MEGKVGGGRDSLVEMSKNIQKSFDNKLNFVNFVESLKKLFI